MSLLMIPKQEYVKIVKIDNQYSIFNINISLKSRHINEAIAQKLNPIVRERLILYHSSNYQKETINSLKRACFRKTNNIMKRKSHMKNI
jgi:hypothetical protein